MFFLPSRPLACSPACSHAPCLLYFPCLLLCLIFAPFLIPYLLLFLLYYSMPALLSDLLPALCPPACSTSPCLPHNCWGSCRSEPTGSQRSERTAMRICISHTAGCGVPDTTPTPETMYKHAQGPNSPKKKKILKKNISLCGV